MQDLTTGSITRHLLKTASFMLVTMVFQTLYFLQTLLKVDPQDAHFWDSPGTVVSYVKMLAAAATGTRPISASPAASSRAHREGVV